MTKNDSIELDAWLQKLGNEKPKDVLGGLERVRSVAKRMGVLPPAKRNIVVGGTNGKGSTTFFLEKLLLTSGKKVGATLSPHINRFNERIRVDGAEADDRSIINAFEIVEKAQEGTPLNYFEFAILAALEIFRQNEVEYCVLEVGLGGRLDAVNIIDADISVITSVGLDHQNYLGDTRESIGFEKAGILRHGVPLVYGERDMPLSVKKKAESLCVPVYQYESAYFQAETSRFWTLKTRISDRTFERSQLSIPLIAKENAATAIQVADLLLQDVSNEAIEEAACVNFPGRAEVIEVKGRRWILDVAHNPDGAKFLNKQLSDRYRINTTMCLFACFQDKDSAGIVLAMESLIGRLVITSSHGDRGQTARITAQKIRESRQVSRKLEESIVIQEDFYSAVEYIGNKTQSTDTVLVFGSFSLIGRMREFLRRQQ